MNPNFSSPRNFNVPQPNGHTPFYNPQPKDIPPHFASNPTISRSPNSLQFIAPNHPSSKSYTGKPAFQSLKTNSNNSTYFKSTIQTSATQGNFNNFAPGYPKVAGDMSKSSFYDLPRVPQHPINFSKNNERLPVNTPNRRQPRYSEPANMDPPPFESAQDTKSSFIPYGNGKGLQNSKEEQDVHFFKKSFQTPESSKEQQKKKTWLKKTPVSTNNKVISFTLDSFELVKNLGSGKYGKVFQARQKLSGFVCALKMIDKAVLIQQEIVQQFIREVKIQMFLNHPNIVKMYGLFEDQQHIYIILQIAMGGQLFQQFKRSQPLPQVKAAGFMKQICTSIDELHSNRIIHRDLKPQNIVLHEGVIKLCDFGWSVHLDNKMRTTFCGTPLYVCPQILRGKQYDEKIDIWSVGVMMYEILVGESPFKINKEEELIKIVKDQISIPSYVYVSKEARDFLDKCLQKNPNDRVTIKELSNHPFLIKNAQKEKNEKKESF